MYICLWSKLKHKHNMTPLSRKTPVAGITTGNAVVDAIHNMHADLTGAGLVDRGELQDIVAKPKQTIITVKSIDGVGATDIIAQLYNEDYLNTTQTDNGSGALSVVTGYNDKFAGKLISNITASKGDLGLRVKQLQIKMVNITTKNQDATAIDASNPILTTFNGDGTKLDEEIPLASTGTPMYNQSGFLIVNVKFGIKRYNQIQMTVPPDTTGTLIIVYE